MAQGKNLFVGVDGGGSHTEFVLISSDEDVSGAVVARATDEATNSNSVGNERACAALQRGLRKLLDDAKAPCTAVKAIVLCMSGVDRDADKQKVAEWARAVAPDAHVQAYNDAVAALLAGTDGQLHGVALICGTGMIAVGFDKSRVQRRAGGWGPLLGDVGSGYSIGEGALVAAVRAADGRGPSSPMCAALLTHLQLASAAELIPWRYSEYRWDRVAALVPFVLEHAERGDAHALSVIDRAADGLFEAVEACVRQLHFDNDEFTIALSGKVLTASDVVRSRFAKRVDGRFPRAKLVPVHGDQAVGAARYARRVFDEQKK